MNPSFELESPTVIVYKEPIENIKDVLPRIGKLIGQKKPFILVSGGNLIEEKPNYPDYITQITPFIER